MCLDLSGYLGISGNGLHGLAIISVEQNEPKQNLARVLTQEDGDLARANGDLTESSGNARVSRSINLQSRKPSQGVGLARILLLSRHISHWQGDLKRSSLPLFGGIDNSSEMCRNNLLHNVHP